MAALGGFLIFVGLFALVVAVIGLVRQRVRWTRVIATRRDAGLLLGASLVLMVIGGAVSPTPPEKVASARAGNTGAVVTTPLTESTTAPMPVVDSPTQAASIPAPRTKPTAAPKQAVQPAPTYTAPAPRYTAPPAQRAYTAPPATSYSQPNRTSGGSTGAYNGGGSSNTYTNVDGNQVERPDGSSAGASAKCKDGTYSHSQHRSGTCSGHGGVAQWL